jgi:NAD(P)-dependent dehydrogenase (short-subunit alcohol dehydrogenase family)
LAAEVAPFGIKVTCIEPGDFRTAVFEASNTRQPSQPVAAYDQFRDRFATVSGTQMGDPGKGAQEIVKLVMGARSIPIRLALGSDAADSLRKTYERDLQSLRDWEEVTRSTDYKDT